MVKSDFRATATHFVILFGFIKKMFLTENVTISRISNTDAERRG